MYIDPVQTMFWPSRPIPIPIPVALGAAGAISARRLAGANVLARRQYRIAPTRRGAAFNTSRFSKYCQY